MKELTFEEKNKLIAKKEKELTKLASKKLKPVIGRYLIVMLIIVTLNFCADIFGSNIHSAMENDAITHLITGGSTEDRFALAENLKLIFGVIVTISLPFYKSLTDKFGRKLFLIINTLVTALGMFIMMSAPNIYLYIMGFVISSVGYQGDVHQIYILESAPKHVRARFAATTKAISILCGSLIGVFRLVFIDLNTTITNDSWRLVFLVPVVFCIVVAIISCFCIQETHTFVENRIANLKREIAELQGESLEEIEKNETEEEKKEAKSLSFKQVISFIFTHKQMLMLFLAALCFCGAMAFTHPYSIFVSQSGDDKALSIVTIIYPIIEGLLSLVGGFISDKAGRRTTVLVNGTLFILAFTLFIIGCRLSFAPFILGIIYGLVAGGYWAGRDVLGTTMPSESCPTSSRASIVGIFHLITGFASSIANFIFSNVAPDGFLDITYLIGCGALMIGAVLIVLFGVKETKNVDLETVTGNEWN